MQASMPGYLEVASDAAQQAEHTAQWLAGQAAQTPGIFRIALCGGETPRPLYQLLANESWRSRMDWTKVEIFWGDERKVPHDHRDSNYRMARELLLDHVPVMQNMVHPIPTDGALDSCAQRYESVLMRQYGRETLNPGKPLFDVVLLGIGTNGHTASLMPGTPVLDERAHWVAGVPYGAPQPRLTLTYPAIASSRYVAFLATGAEKAAPVAAARAGDKSLPAARVRCNGEIVWFLDRAAAGDALHETQPTEPHARKD